MREFEVSEEVGDRGVRRMELTTGSVSRAATGGGVLQINRGPKKPEELRRKPGKLHCRPLTPPPASVPDPSEYEPHPSARSLAEPPRSDQCRYASESNRLTCAARSPIDKLKELLKCQLRICSQTSGVGSFQGRRLGPFTPL